jgi:hypothetical protein
VLMLAPTEPFECWAQVVRLDDDVDRQGAGHVLAAFRFLNLEAQDEARIAEALAALQDETDPTAVPTPWRRPDPPEGMAG